MLFIAEFGICLPAPPLECLSSTPVDHGLRKNVNLISSHLNVGGGVGWGGGCK